MRDDRTGAADVDDRRIVAPVARRPAVDDGDGFGAARSVAAFTHDAPPERGVADISSPTWAVR